jgi:hypothetical protein
MIRFHGDPEPVRDPNAEFRNVSVAEAIHSYTSYRADGVDLWTTNEKDAYLLEVDPPLELDAVSWHAPRSSDLVNYAASVMILLPAKAHSRAFPNAFVKWRREKQKIRKSKGGLTWPRICVVVWNSNRPWR